MSSVVGRWWQRWQTIAIPLDAFGNSFIHFICMLLRVEPKQPLRPRQFHILPPFIRHFMPFVPNGLAHQLGATNPLIADVLPSADGERDRVLERVCELEDHSECHTIFNCLRSSLDARSVKYESVHDEICGSPNDGTVGTDVLHPRSVPGERPC